MSEKGTGQVLELDRKGGRTFALRFRAYGKRRYVTLGTAGEGWSRRKAEDELANVLADVRRGIWTPDELHEAKEPAPEPSFHEFASEWLHGLRLRGAVGEHAAGLLLAAEQPSAAVLRQAPALGDHDCRG